MKRRFAALAVTGSLVISGVLVASPAHAWVKPVPESPTGYTVVAVDPGPPNPFWTDETRRAEGVYHFRFGRASGGYRWNDMLDKKKNHRTETTHLQKELYFFQVRYRAVSSTYKVTQHYKGVWSYNFQATKGNAANYSVIRY